MLGPELAWDMAKREQSSHSDQQWRMAIEGQRPRRLEVALHMEPLGPRATASNFMVVTRARPRWRC